MLIYNCDKVKKKNSIDGLYDKAQHETSDFHEGLCTTFKTIFEGHNNFNEGKYKNVCKVTLYYITDLISNNRNIVHGCKYLYNRLSDELIETVQNSTGHFTFYKTLLKEYCNIQDCLEIIKNNIEDFSKPVFENHKNLVELYNNLQKIHHSAKCDGAREFVHLYEDKLVECIGVTNDDFCDELDRFKQDYENVMRNKSCDDVPKHLPSIHGHNTLFSIIIPVSVTLFTSIVLFIMYKVII
ncbi:hypothetical protein PVMG_04728 [Plasmodium vivax Mauritania I]|uniref:Variable surface protein n=1 Tax=Plasmodium vivax Mauritania I TaxID=1035515 RepID=A0A0J9W4R2_PLAVI|nr:hypothetical protein PVMG_04728 [Plasmodium vivax Mauritania I]